MKIAVAAPANGNTLKEAVYDALANDPRVTLVEDLSRDGATYPVLSLETARKVAAGDYDRAVLICGTGIGTAIAASKIPGARAATAHDLVSARGAVENYNAQILCFGQNIIAAPVARALLDVWLDARHDPTSTYGELLRELNRLTGE